MSIKYLLNTMYSKPIPLFHIYSLKTYIACTSIVSESCIFHKTYRRSVNKNVSTRVNSFLRFCAFKFSRIYSSVFHNSDIYLYEQF